MNFEAQPSPQNLPPEPSFNLIALASPECGDVHIVGGKALGLSRMIRSCLPVPNGFVIPTPVFEAVLDGITIVGAPRMSEAQAEAVRQAIEQRDLPSDLVKNILIVAEQLGFPLAVRSSSTAEDMRESSFAGAYVSELEIRDHDSLIAAVKQCMASFFGMAPIENRAKHNIDGASMAIIIQKMVPAALSGTMFTAHPVTGSRSDIRVACTEGLGESLVSGERPLETVFVDRVTREVLHRESLSLSPKPSWCRTPIRSVHYSAL